MDKSKDKTEKESPTSEKPQRQRKKRLSRKEQKARKKQRHAQTTKTRAAKEPPPPIQKEVPYKKTPIPDSLPPSAASLGKWFPEARKIKSAVTYSNDSKTTARASILLFYQYKSPSWSESRVSHFLAYLAKIAETRKTLGGRIRVAPEGINATVSSVDTEDCDAKTTLQHFCRDLQEFDSVFQETDFKLIHDQPPDRHFKEIKLIPVKELVFYGFGEEQAPLTKGGVHVAAQDFHDMLQQDNTVVVDVRNHYEAAIGRFSGKDQKAVYVNPKMRKSTDWKSWLAKPETREKLQGKKVLMYCTGGVRCERASSYLNTEMGSNLDGIYQLQGGIERYLQAFPTGGHWRGKNFVFDKREAISADNRQGDGGVVRHSTSNNVAETHCCLCDKPWDRYIGKRKCTMCGVPVLVCDSCLSSKQDSNKPARCPLCVEEDITIPAAQVEYTDNGVAAAACATKDGSKAAPSVLKWGGGHASKKKEKRRWKRKPCQFGADCIRKDCFFAHPERKATK